jgi:hypothetical protein
MSGRAKVIDMREACNLLAATLVMSAPLIAATYAVGKTKKTAKPPGRSCR